MALIVEKLQKGGYLHTYTAEPPRYTCAATAVTHTNWRDGMFDYLRHVGMEPAHALAILAADRSEPVIPPITPVIVAEESPADDDESTLGEPPRKDWTACNLITGECE